MYVCMISTYTQMTVFKVFNLLIISIYSSDRKCNELTDLSAFCTVASVESMYCIYPLAMHVPGGQWPAVPGIHYEFNVRLYLHS